MPWYGMHLIDRVRHQAAETERNQRVDATEPADQFAEALPTLLVVAVWGIASAMLYCAMAGIKQWDIVLTAAIAPVAMVLVGAVWGQQKSSLRSGLDAAIVTGAIAGLLFVVGALW